MKEYLDVNGKPIPKEYVKVQDDSECGSFLILKSKFDIDMIFPDDTEEKYILSTVYLNDEEFAAIPEFTGF